MKNKINLKSKKYILVLILCIAYCININSQSNRFYIKPSATFIYLNENSTSDLAGTSLTNAFSMSDSKTLAISLGYNFLPNTFIDVVFGIPPSSDIIGQKEFEGIELGSIKYAPAIITIDYKFIRLGKVSSTIGAGINYTYIFEETDKGIEGFTVNNYLAPLAKFGLDLMLTTNVSFSITANRIINGSTSVLGKINSEIPNLGGAPFTSEVELNSTALQFGMTFNF